MSRIPDVLRENIARNISQCRKAKFPGRGGGKRCAEAFGVSPQQWSPWERGKRIPDETRLAKLAEFFGVTVEFLRRDNSDAAIAEAELSEVSPELALHMSRKPNPERPGSPESFYWLADWVATAFVAGGAHNNATTRMQERLIELLLKKLPMTAE